MTQEGLSGWWTTVVDADEEVGGEIRFTFEDPFHPVMEIVALESNERIEWRCKNPPWENARITFELADSEGHADGCELRFQQDYQAADERTFGIFNFNWAYYLESLRLLVTEGAGKPFDAEAGERT